MFDNMRKLMNVPNSSRSKNQYSHFCYRTLHRLIAYPLYTCFALFIFYLLIMECVLYFQIRTRSSFDEGTIKTNKTKADTSNQMTHGHIFSSLAVKEIMVGPATQYFRSPLSELIESKFFFTYYFPFISANSISFLHCFLAVLSIKFFSNESLSRRQIGVLMFEIRSILDCLDGVVFRAHAKNQRYKSYYGALGYYIDAVSDVLGGACLVIGCLLYLLKHRPLRTITRSTSQSSPSRTSPASDEEKDLMMLNLDDDVKIPMTNEIVESKQRIWMAFVFFSLRYGLSAMFWDRTVRGYEELLDSYQNRKQTQILQLNVLHSPLTIIIFYLWRYISAITLQDFLLCSVFFDRTWDFIHKTRALGWIALLLSVALTELHLDQLRSIFSIL